MRSSVVFLKCSNNGIERGSLSIITLANKLSSTVTAILTGETDKRILKQLKRYGVDVAYFIDRDDILSAYINVVSDILMNFFDWEIGILPSDWWGIKIGAILSAKIKAGFVSNVVGIEKKSNELILKKEIFLGKVLGEYTIKTTKKIIAVRSNLFPIEQKRRGGISTKELFVDINKDCNYTVEKREKLFWREDSEIIISGGAGVESKEKFKHYIISLANMLGAGVGASRIAVDKGYADVQHQIGQTGKKVSPKVYMAIGISGAIQHIAGMVSSRYVIAVNKDRDAPIFEYADYIIISDLFKFVEEFVKVIKDIKGENGK